MGYISRYYSMRVPFMLAIIFIIGGLWSASAAENGVGTYVLGQKGQGAGILPPEGIYSINPFYFYSGEASPSITLPLGGNLATDIQADIGLYLPTGVWVTPVEALGGDLALAVVVPVGSMDLDVGATLSPVPPFPPLTGAVSDSWSGVGDPQASATLGWHEGASHWNIGTTVNIPIGDYDAGELANIAYNHWSVDITGAYTWLDPAVGLELTAAAGVTFNDTNSATAYKTGTEFHLEFAAAAHLSQDVAVGVTGYHYQQLSGDSGAGATLGPFKGEVTALGMEANWIVPVGPGVPLFFNVKVLEEFDTTNRLDGRSAWARLTIPLGGPGAPPGGGAPPGM